MKWFAPYMKERIQLTKQHTDAFLFSSHLRIGFQSDLPSLIEAGVDILNPIQPRARDMEPQKLTKRLMETSFRFGVV